MAKKLSKQQRLKLKELLERRLKQKHGIAISKNQYSELYKKYYETITDHYRDVDINVHDDED